MWTETAREQYRREDLRYASDMTDAEWALISPHLPGEKSLGRPRIVPLRGVVDALLYILRTACPWRLLPRDFPKRSTVQRYFYAWQAEGLWEKVNFLLVQHARERVFQTVMKPRDVPVNSSLWLPKIVSGLAQMPRWAILAWDA